MKKRSGFKLKYLVLTWIIVLFIIGLSALIMYLVSGEVNSNIVSIIIAFASFIATSFFSISIFNHNASIREQNAEIRSQTQAVNRRAELFRNLQFMASHYTIIEFIDHAFLYEENLRYINRLFDTKNFHLYLLEMGIDKDDVIDNREHYSFLTLKIPIKILEGKAIGKITFAKLKFEKENSVHRFVPPENIESEALILFNDKEHRQEAIINLIIRKSSEFYKRDELNPFIKIRFLVNMESFLGVVVSGLIELYFTNPEKIEESGMNSYKINSSLFELMGKPKLNIGKEYEPGGLD